METRIFGKRRYVYKGSIAWYFLKGKSKLGDALRYLWESRSVIALILFVACITFGFMILSMPKANAEPLVNDLPATKVETETETVIFDVPLSADLQRHITETCDQYAIDPRLVIAVIERESNYNPNAIGDNGTSFGLMQVRQMFHEDRMERLGCTNLLDPYQNITVGVDILREKLTWYDTIEEALTAYNAGDTGAYDLYFSKGIKANQYALDVMEIMFAL